MIFCVVLIAVFCSGLFVGSFFPGFLAWWAVGSLAIGLVVSIAAQVIQRAGSKIDRLTFL